MTGKKSAPTRPVARAGVALPAVYASLLDALILKARIRAAQIKAALAVNGELVLL